MTDLATLADLAAEQAMIGACLLDGRGVIRTEILGTVDPADCWRGQHRTVLETIAGLHADGKPVDPMTVADALAESGHDSAALLLSDCCAATPAAANGVHYARTVAQLARRRRVLDAAHRLAARAGDRAEDLDAATADACDALASCHAADSTVDAGTLVDEALAALDDADRPLGWGPPGMGDAWRVVPGWVHLILGWPSSGKSAWVDWLLVALAESDDVHSLVWSPEGAPSAGHMLRMARIRSGTASAAAADAGGLMAAAWREGDAVVALDWVANRVAWLPHERHRTLDGILAATDAYRARHRADVVVIDPYTSVDKHEHAGEGWDRILNLHLSRMQAWARARDVALIVVSHPKDLPKQPSGVWPVATAAAGGAMWNNQVDSRVSVWRDERGSTRAKNLVDVHVQKIREDGKGGQMGRVVKLARDEAGRYLPVSEAL